MCLLHVLALSHTINNHAMQESSKGIYDEIKCKGPLVYCHHFLAVLNMEYKDVSNIKYKI